MRWLVLLALASCDRVLKLDDISPHGDGGSGGDGGGDGGGDAPAAGCPLDGSAPTFLGAPHRIALGCKTYTVGDPAWPSLGSGNLATADCSGVVKAGLQDGALGDPQTGLSGTNPHQFTPDQILMTSGTTITSYVRDVLQDRWTSPTNETFASFATGDMIGSPSNTLPRLDMVFQPASVSSAQLIEYVEQSAHTWTNMGTLALLGPKPAGPANVSSDGLRLVFPALMTTSVGAYFLSRSSVVVPFSGAPTLLTDIGNTGSTPFMADDCQTLYFTSGGDVYEVGR